MQVEIDERTAQALEKFTEIEVENHEAGSASRSDWENARSYAVEAVVALFLANREVFRYKGEMDAINKKRQALR